MWAAVTTSDTMLHTHAEYSRVHKVSEQNSHHRTAPLGLGTLVKHWQSLPLVTVVVTVIDPEKPLWCEAT